MPSLYIEILTYEKNIIVLLNIFLKQLLCKTSLMLKFLWKHITFYQIRMCMTLHVLLIAEFKIQKWSACLNRKLESLNCSCGIQNLLSDWSLCKSKRPRNYLSSEKNTGSIVCISDCVAESLYNPNCVILFYMHNKTTKNTVKLIYNKKYKLNL